MNSGILFHFCVARVRAFMFAYEGAHVCMRTEQAEGGTKCFPLSLGLYLLRQGLSLELRTYQVWLLYLDLGRS